MRASTQGDEEPHAFRQRSRIAPKHKTAKQGLPIPQVSRTADRKHHAQCLSSESGGIDVPQFNTTDVGESRHLSKVIQPVGQLAQE